MKIKKQRGTAKIMNGPVTCMIRDPQRQDTIITTGSHGKISKYQVKSFRLIEQFKIFNQSSTCISKCGQNLLVGSRLGQLVHIKINGQVIDRIQLHDDYISSISDCNTTIVTTGYDGKVIFLNKQSLQVEKKLEFQSPIWASKYYQGKIYICGSPSYSIDCDTFKICKQKNYNQFEVVNQKLYGCSNEKGFTYVQKNDNLYIPCHYIIGFNNKILLFSQECGTQVTHKKNMQFKCARIKQIKKGSSIISGIAVDNFIVLGDNQGNLHRIQYVHQQNQQQKQ